MGRWILNLISRGLGREGLTNGNCRRDERKEVNSVAQRETSEALTT